jgi:hypothetical protein
MQSKNYEQMADSLDGIMVYADAPSRFGGILWASVNPRWRTRNNGIFAGFLILPYAVGKPLTIS